MANPIKLVVHVESGFICSFSTDSDLDISIALHDVDTEGVYLDEISVLPDSSEFFGRIDKPVKNAERVEHVFSAIDNPAMVIRSFSERGYWSNSEGWVFDVHSATKFGNAYHNLPESIGRDAEYILVADADDFLREVYSVGDIVYWNDPGDGASSGKYTIADIYTETHRLCFSEETCLLVNDSGSEAEVYAFEIAS